MRRVHEHMIETDDRIYSLEVFSHNLYSDYDFSLHQEEEGEHVSSSSDHDTPKSTQAFCTPFN